MLSCICAARRTSVAGSQNLEASLGRAWAPAAGLLTCPTRGVILPSVQELIDLLAGTSETMELDRAALAVASIECPGLDPGPYVQLLDSYAVELAGKLPEDCSGGEFVARTNRYLFEELGFRGNTGDYYDPLNSCLNEVLTTRTGIPITLSIVYIEITRRLAKPVYGVGLPGHFLVRYESPEYTTFIDPFHGGRLLGHDGCYELAKQMTGVDFSSDPGVLSSVGKRHIAVRMLNNLRGIYLSRSMDRKAIEDGHEPLIASKRTYKKWFGFAGGLLAQTPAAILLIITCFMDKPSVISNTNTVYNILMPIVSAWYITYSSIITYLRDYLANYGIPYILPYFMFIFVALFALFSGLAYLHGPAVDKKIETIIERNVARGARRVQDEWKAEKRRKNMQKKQGNRR